MHEKFLNLALEQAQKRQGFCAPNPAVGAVLVISGEVVAAGTHDGPGTPHAEVRALENISASQYSPTQWEQATLYVTLEPCCHHGRTPPCTDLILSRGIKHVVYAFADPNPVVSGKGHQALSACGVRVEHVPNSAVNEFYAAYNHWWRTGKPRMRAKLAISLDGKTAGPNRVPAAITGEQARRFTHTQRLKADGILTTSQTILYDDPQLNVRLGHSDTGTTNAGTQAVAKPVYVLDRLGRLPWTAKVVQTASRLTLFHGIEADECRLEALKQSGVKLVRTPTVAAGLDLKFVVEHLGKEGLHDVWVESGSRSFCQFLDENLLDEAYLLVGLKVLGAQALTGFESLPSALSTASSFHCSAVGRDALLEWKWER